MLRHVSRKSGRSAMNKIMAYTHKTTYYNTILQRNWVSQKHHTIHSHIQSKIWHPVTPFSNNRHFSTSFQPTEDNLDNPTEVDTASIPSFTDSSSKHNNFNHTKTLDNVLDETKDQDIVTSELTFSRQIEEQNNKDHSIKGNAIHMHDNVSHKVLDEIARNEGTQTMDYVKESKLLNQRLAAAIRENDTKEAMDLLRNWEKKNKKNKKKNIKKSMNDAQNDFIHEPEIRIHMDHLVDLLSLTVKEIDSENVIFSLYIIGMIVRKEEQELKLKKQILLSSEINKDLPISPTSSNNKNNVNIPLDFNHAIPVSTYINYCKSIQMVDRLSNDESRNIIHSLFQRLKALDYEIYQKEIFPIFLISTLSHSKTQLSIKRFGFSVWKYMQDHNIQCSNIILEEVLKRAKINLSNRQIKNTDIPVDHVLKQLVNNNVQPDSSVVIKTLKQLYPFEKTELVTRLLQSIKTLYEREKAKAEPNESMNAASSSSLSSSTSSSALKYPHAYRIPLGTLESIASTAAQTNALDLLLLTWDIAEMMGYRPTENLYESAIHGFANSYKQDHNAFAVISEMHTNGHTLSRALTRFVAKQISHSIARTNNAYYILTNDKEANLINVSSLNCVLAAYAKLGQVDLAFLTYDEFIQMDVKPNADTFSYLMEALANKQSLSSSEKSPTDYINHDQGRSTQEEDQVDESSWNTSGSQLKAADSIVSMMSKLEQEPDPYVLHNHICILIRSKEIPKAKAMLLDAIKSKQMILLQTFGHLIHYLLEAKDVKSARKICDWMRTVANEHGDAWKTNRDVVPPQLEKSIYGKAIKK